MLERTVEADSSELSGCWAGHSRQSSTILIPARSQRLKKVFLNFLHNCSDCNPKFVDLKENESNFFASIGLQVERRSWELLLDDIVVHRNLDDVFGFVYDVDPDRRL